MPNRKQDACGKLANRKSRPGEIFICLSYTADWEYGDFVRSGDLSCSKTGLSRGSDRLDQSYFGGVQSDHYDGPITPWNPPSFETVVFVNYNVDGGVALVRTDVSRQDNSGSTRLALTTYSNMYFANSVSTGNATYLVNNKAYWEFVIDGNYDWEIRDTDPLIRSSVNRRTYEFAKVQGGRSQLFSQIR